MNEFDWHAERAGLSQFDRSTEGDGIDHVAVRAWRQGRVRAEMAARGIDAVILSDPVNIRYATGTRNMQVFSSRNTPSRYLVMTADRAILFEFTGCEHLAAGFETVDEVRPASTASFVAAGPEIARRERVWAREMAGLLAELTGGPGAKVGIERLNAGVVLALAAEGIQLVDAQEPVEMARSVKSTEELKCVVASLRATEVAVGRLREAIRPGLTEAELWSVLHQSVIAQNADYVETRLLSAGERTNPWFQEAGDKVIGPNELVALDTDVVGVHGYYADFSRTFHAGPAMPTPSQRELYKLAHEQVHHNIGIIRPGLSFRDYAQRAWDIPERYHANRYYLSAHGCGMTGEYPYLYHHGDFPNAGYDGEIVPGMVLCVESYIGAQDGSEGVKLEQQLVVTETGTELLSRFPFEAALLA
ncbi:Xaa-Pro peptidase family protein [Maritimibacter sp. HL-12]|uniref:M24 family metallopeptidase n=1 Tax=Maritimibacter sp. HL-12 TaxID=1162418 RepID=UPI000A0F240E|nr:Xaa-Pro peptidase family protein [Maritimibacter sp. HL-12]SMH40759.1 Xaa-Pro aminopeptidase [Maritimibacter sp. HL-12]